MMTAQELKMNLSSLPLGQCSEVKFVANFHIAMSNAKADDPDPSGHIPAPMQTKVYKLAESLLALVKK